MAFYWRWLFLDGDGHLCFLFGLFRDLHFSFFDPDTPSVKSARQPEGFPSGVSSANAGWIKIASRKIEGSGLLMVESVSIDIF
jgi:hypothetical protein